MPVHPTLRLPLRSDRLILRLPTLRDVDPWFHILTDPTVMRLMSPRRPWDRGQVVEKVRAAHRGARSGHLYELAVELESTGEVIGRVALKEVDPVRRRAELAYWFSADAWGQGFAPEAAHVLLQAAFRDLGLHRVDAGVFAYNVRSQSVVRRLGFRREGALREAFRYRGRWTDEYRYGLLAGELRPLGEHGKRSGTMARARRRARARD